MGNKTTKVPHSEYFESKFVSTGIVSLQHSADKNSDKQTESKE